MLSICTKVCNEMSGSEKKSVFNSQKNSVSSKLQRNFVNIPTYFVTVCFCNLKLNIFLYLLALESASLFGKFQIIYTFKWAWLNFVYSLLCTTENYTEFVLIQGLLPWPWKQIYPAVRHTHTHIHIYWSTSRFTKASDLLVHLQCYTD